MLAGIDGALSMVRANSDPALKCGNLSGAITDTDPGARESIKAEGPAGRPAEPGVESRDQSSSTAKLIALRRSDAGLAIWLVLGAS